MQFQGEKHKKHRFERLILNLPKIASVDRAKNCKPSFRFENFFFRILASMFFLAYFLLLKQDFWQRISLGLTLFCSNESGFLLKIEETSINP